MAGSFEKVSPGTAPPRVPRSPPDWPLAGEVYPLLRTRWDLHVNSAALSGRVSNASKHVRSSWPRGPGENAAVLDKREFGILGRGPHRSRGSWLLSIRELASFGRAAFFRARGG